MVLLAFGQVRLRATTEDEGVAVVLVSSSSDEGVAVVLAFSSSDEGVAVVLVPWFIDEEELELMIVLVEFALLAVGRASVEAWVVGGELAMMVVVEDTLADDLALVNDTVPLLSSVEDEKATDVDVVVVVRFDIARALVVELMMVVIGAAAIVEVVVLLPGSTVAEMFDEVRV